MSCGSCSQKSSSWNSPIIFAFHVNVLWDYILQLRRSYAGHLMNPTHWENLTLIFLRFPPEKKKKTKYMICM